jgi:hypothetical protein
MSAAKIADRFGRIIESPPVVGVAAAVQRHAILRTLERRALFASDTPS